ncbi:MAG TPA: hypothetical protein EYN69_03370 [Flavobacteriales bacterium]|nr:hypothetical protein [Flavobacteriales bacterium]
MSEELNRSILKEADEIVNHRSEEKVRQYGPFGEGMERAAAICSGMTGKKFTAHDMFAALIALKFSRQSYNHKEDNLLDAAAYIGAWQNYINEKSKMDPELAGPDVKPDAPKRLVPPSNHT